MANSRVAADLTDFPGLVVVYLGFRLRGWRNWGRFFGIGRGLQELQAHKPDGLLAHESVLWGWMHLGMRQYWRDLDSMLAYTRGPQHAAWWRDFTANSGGNGFWHETYCRQGGMEAIYLNMPPIGLGKFARSDNPLAGARQRIVADRATSAPPDAISPV